MADEEVQRSKKERIAELERLLDATNERIDTDRERISTLEHALGRDLQAAELAPYWLGSGTPFRKTGQLGCFDFDVRELTREIIECERHEHVWYRSSGERVHVREMDHRHVCNALALLIREPDAFTSIVKRTGHSVDTWIVLLRVELHRRLDAYIAEMTREHDDVSDRDSMIESFGKELKNAFWQARFRRGQKKDY